MNFNENANKVKLTSESLAGWKKRWELFKYGDFLNISFSGLHILRHSTEIMSESMTRNKRYKIPYSNKTTMSSACSMHGNRKLTAPTSNLICLKASIKFPENLI